MEDEQYKKLPAEEKCIHKIWKARVNGYEEVTKLFRQLDDEKSPEFGKYLGLVNKFVVDSNAVGQEKGLEATLAYVKNYAHAGKTVSEVMSGVVAKCIAASKTKTRELALQLTLMYIEIEKQEAVEEELIKGMELKNPKIISACVNTCTEALREFGTKIISVKPLLKKISALLSNRDKTVRDETKLMVIEMFRWIGGALRPQLQAANLQAIQITELEGEFAKIEGQKAVPTRYIRSQQVKQAKLAVQAAAGDVQEEQEEEIDPYEIAPAVEILSKIPKDFYEKLEAKKWQERKEVLEVIGNLVKTPKLEAGDYGDLVRALKKVVQKDSNVVCVTIASRCIAGLATGLKTKFKTYSEFCIPAILEKFKEKRQNVLSALREAGDAIYMTTTLEAILEDVLEALNNKNPSVKTETSLFLARGFTKTTLTAVNKKLLKAITAPLARNINESDPSVRESSAEALGILMKLVGEKTIGPLLIDLENDKLKMAKIKAFCDNAVICVKSTGAKKKRTAPVSAKTIKTASNKSETKASTGVVKSFSTNNLDALDDHATNEPEKINIQDLIPRTDISSQITDSILKDLGDKNWKIRNEALNKLRTIINEAKFVKPNLEDLPQALTPRLTDSNVKLAQIALSLCETICKAMGPPFKQYVRVFFPSILQGLGDSKAFMRTASLETINSFKEQCGYKEFFEGEMIADALKSGSPTLRIEVWNWLAKNLPKVPPKQISKDELVACIPHLYSNLEDRNADVRKNAQEAVLGIMLHLGFDSMSKQAENLKLGSKTVVIAALDKARPNLPIKPLPTKKQPVEKEDKAIKGTKSVANAKNVVKKPNTAKSAQASSRKKEEDIDTSALLVINNFKHQRTIDENKLKVLKWNFTQPREEFVELLKDQMNTANVNKSLTANMFHNDFRYHLKALDSLNDDLADNSEALISNLDLILKWLTLRFFDTNPSVLLKGLEYLQFVFNMLIDKKYKLLENEASAFIPYLINKVGDPKDSVRNGVKALLNQITRLYPVNKLFTSLMDGVKSKNARQRAECLDVMGAIIEDFGITVCVPTPAACLKEVAKQISDRDNSVRNAALNCVVQAYNIVGEKVYKLVGNISDKDMSLLEERIKRSSRKAVNFPKPDANATVVTTTVISPQKESTSPNKHNIDSTVIRVSNDNDEQEEDIEEENLPPVNLPSQIRATEPRKQILGPFSLDPEFMEELERKRPPSGVKMIKVESDLDFLNHETRMPTIGEAEEQVRARRAALTKSNPPVTLNQTITRLSPASTKVNSKKQDTVLERLIKQMGLQNAVEVLAAITQLHELLATTRGNAMIEYEDDFMNMVITQFKHIQNADLSYDSFAPKIYKNLFTIIDVFYANKSLGTNVSMPVIKELMYHLIHLLVEERLNNLPNGEAYVRVINVHCVKVIERSNHTNLICALVQLINDYISNKSSARHVDLVMKCLWRVIKLMPQWGDDIDYDLVFLEVHNFLKKFPSSWWRTKEADTPLKTVKTILHSSAKIKGGTIMLHLGKIPNTSESEIESYILRVLKSLKISEIQQIAVKHEIQRRSLSRANHKMLTDIFQKIGSKDETKDGLNSLYDFMQSHPESDIEPFLATCSKFFQDYIRNGLKEIADSRKITNKKVGDALTEKNEFETIKPSTSRFYPEFWESRLRMWNYLFDEVKAGKDVEPLPWQVPW